MLTEKTIAEGVLRHGLDIVKECRIDHSLIEKYLTKIQQEYLDYPLPKQPNDFLEWFMPSEYKNLDIEAFLFDNCPKEHRDRLIIELQEYKKRNLLDLLRQMKYIVDTLRKNSIVWGVGRGSSVASYVLFLLGVHKIDSIKYNLPLEEFFKGGENG